MVALAHNLPTLPPFSSSLGGPSQVVVVVRSRRPHLTRRPLTRTGCRRNSASPSARTLPLSAGWDAIRPPRRHHRCHCRAAISTVAHPWYPPDADPGHARQHVSCCRRCRRHPLPPLPTASRSRRNAASPPARASPSSVGWWDAIRPPRLVAVTPQSPPSPIPSIRQTRTPDTPVDVFIINAVVDVALSPLCPPPVAGQVWHVLLLPPHVVVVVVVSTSSQGR